MVAALAPEELAYQIVMTMNEKLHQAPHVERLQLNKCMMAEAIASAYANTNEYRQVVMEGIEAACVMGLLLPESGTHGDPYLSLTRSGKRIVSGDQATLHRVGSLQAKDLLDRRIHEAVWTTYLRGDYDIAISYAFKRVEIEMRAKAGLTGADYGERLVKKFFTNYRLPNEASGPKANSLTPAEYLLIGGLDLYRNPATHFDDTINDYARAMEVMLIASHYLHLVRDV